MTLEIVALPVSDFPCVALAAARRALQVLLATTVRPVDAPYIEETPVQLKITLNALDMRYEYAISNRLLKVLDSAPWPNPSAPELMAVLFAFRAAAGANRDTPVQAGVAIATRYVNASLDALQERLEGADTFDTRLMSHLVAQRLVFIENLYQESVRLWIQQMHPDLAGRSWAINLLEITCPILLVSPHPESPLLDADDMDFQKAEMHRYTLPFEIEEAVGAAFSKRDSQQAPAGVPCKNPAPNQVE